MNHLLNVLLAVGRAGAVALPTDSAPQVNETTPPAVVTPAPTQPPFRGVIAPTVDQAKPAWNLLQRAPEGAPNILADPQGKKFHDACGQAAQSASGYSYRLQP